MARVNASKLLDKIPDPDTVRIWLADSIRQAELLRALLRLSKRKAGVTQVSSVDDRKVVPHELNAVDARRCRKAVANV